MSAAFISLGVCRATGMPTRAAAVIATALALAGWIHGVFNSQAYGIWRMLLFAGTNPVLGGITGLVGIAVISILGLVTMRRFKRVVARVAVIES